MTAPVDDGRLERIGDAAHAATPPHRVEALEDRLLVIYSDGLRDGYRQGTRDLERAKSEAAGDGYHRGLERAERFITPKAAQRSRIELACWAIILGALLGGALEARRRDRARLEETDDDL